MKGQLRDLARAAPASRRLLPAGVFRLLALGVTATDADLRRRQIFTNVGAAVLALNATSHLVGNGLQHDPALVPVHIYNVIVMLFAAAVPALHRFGENVGAIVLCTVIVVGHTWVVFAFGLDSDLQVYFTFAGAMLFLFGVDRWKLFLSFYLAAFAALVFSLTQAGPTGFIMPENAEFRRSLAVHGMVNAIIINGLLIGYALTALSRAEAELGRQYARSEALLGAILPAPIAARLKSGRERRIADRVKAATILFADIAGFTPAAARVSPEELVGFLDALVCEFDDLCATFGVDKIKTVGDAYLAAGGLHGDEAGGALAVGRLAIAMQAAMARRGTLGGNTLALRIGIHTGPVIAGVIGDARIAYDVWGDTVNVAQRMEAHGAAGRIQVSESFVAMTRDSFVFEARGALQIKGLGAQQAWFLIGEGQEAELAATL